MTSLSEVIKKLFWNEKLSLQMLKFVLMSITSIYKVIIAKAKNEWMNEWMNQSINQSIKILYWGNWTDPKISPDSWYFYSILIKRKEKKERRRKKGKKAIKLSYQKMCSSKIKNFTKMEVPTSK